MRYGFSVAEICKQIEKHLFVTERIFHPVSNTKAFYKLFYFSENPLKYFFALEFVDLMIMLTLVNDN